MERRARQEDASLIRARSVDLAMHPCQYGRVRWPLICGLLVSVCLMVLGSLGVAPFAAPLRSVGRHFNHASTGEVTAVQDVKVCILSTVVHPYPPCDGGMLGVLG